MGDGLSVSAGGTTSVASDELEAAGVMLGQLAREAEDMLYQLASIDRLNTYWSLDRQNAPASAARAEGMIDQAQSVLAQIQAIATTLGWAVQSAADGYIFAEWVVTHYLRQRVGDLAGLLGVTPVGLLATGSFALAGSNAQIRSDPAYVAALRESVMYGDDAAMGALGIPRPLAALLGDEGLGLVGLSTTATLLAGAGIRLGVVRNTPVRMVGQTTQPIPAAAQTFEERLERVPTPTTSDGAQVVVEKYEFADKPDAFVAYISGTVTFDPAVADEPFDLESNVLNAVGPGSGSAEAVRQALVAAGAAPDSPVQLVGYSQGGATGAQVAASGEFAVQGILTFGSPTGQIELPTDIPAVIVEHTDDLVPALGGRQDNAAATVVERRVYESGQVPDGPIPAHVRTNYVETAQLMDDTKNREIMSTLRQLNDLTAGATSATSTRYEFERVEAGAEPVEFSARAYRR